MYMYQSIFGSYRVRVSFVIYFRLVEDGVGDFIVEHCSIFDGSIKRIVNRRVIHVGPAYAWTNVIIRPFAWFVACIWLVGVDYEVELEWVTCSASLGKHVSENVVIVNLKTGNFSDLPLWEVKVVFPARNSKFFLALQGAQGFLVQVVVAGFVMRKDFRLVGAPFYYVVSCLQIVDEFIQFKEVVPVGKHSNTAYKKGKFKHLPVIADINISSKLIVFWSNEYFH